ncbi:hypothetical protein [Candidatus Laterigemmans baculatus]|uniref:hypothetical protein n=1 Tax=Candidatus Laterigemmans baculatus TaxID=2770505 RepID=UPI0013DABF0D|nr:hypothetical protein [Candidatus Laterigemmans baculatus]
MVQLVGSTAFPRPASGPAPAPLERGLRSPLAAAPADSSTSRRLLCLVLLCLVLLWTAVAGGCRSRAYQDVYVEKLTGEIRTLEDKLHAADYSNHVLRQKLARLEARQGRAASERLPAEDAAPDELEIRIAPDRDAGSRDPGATRDTAPSTPPRQSTPLPADPSDLDIEIDLGEPVTPAPIQPDAGRPDAGRPDDGELPAPPSLPPVQPLPPRAGEFETPPIELGEPLPPGEPDDDQTLPPGQIPTPESARRLYPATPATIAIHAGLSGRHHHDSDDVEDGLYLVLTLADAEGRPVRAQQPVSVVVLDPAQTGEAARLGRWDFTAQEIEAHYRQTPIPSLQLPILWQEARPSGDSVAVFVRLMTDEAEPLETDMLMEFQAGAGGEWTSRGRGTYSAQLGSEKVWE